MSYNTLQNYNAYDASSCQDGRIKAPISIQVVPVYGAPGYETLTHGGVCSGGHVEILQAYPSVCDKFVQRACDGSVKQPGPYTGSSEGYCR